MIAALLLAGACALPPSFETTGPNCPAAGECLCSECFAWTPVAGATRYEIRRHDPGGAIRAVGSSKILGGYVDADGTFLPPDPQELWCVPWDSTMPKEGKTYSYEINACRGAICSAFSGAAGLSGTTWKYVGAPYWCWVNGQRVQCP